MTQESWWATLMGFDIDAEGRLQLRMRPVRYSEMYYGPDERRAMHGDICYDTMVLWGDERDHGWCPTCGCTQR